MEYYVAERCIDDKKCPNHIKPGSECKRGKFHGNATGLEVASAKALFKKTEIIRSINLNIPHTLATGIVRWGRRS